MPKFTTSSQIADYIDGDSIQCLECGKFFRTLGRHIASHGMTQRDYKEAWAIPATTPLAGCAYRDAHRAKILRMQEEGALNYDHLPQAAAKGAAVKNKPKIGVAKTEHAALVAKMRPGDAALLLPPGAKRTDGRDAAKERKAQQRRRANVVKK